MAKQTSTQLDSTRVRELIREFMETESLLQEAVGGAVDAVLDPETGTPVLLRRAQAELRLLLQQLPAIAWTVDRELRITSLQGTGLAALDLKPGTLVGRHLSEASPLGAPDEDLLEAHRRALEGRPADLMLDRAGWVWQVHVEALHDAEGNAAGVVGVALDTTARAQAEAEVRRMRDELEETVQLRTRQLVRVNEELAIAGEELRVQNDDLLAARRELEAERQRYRSSLPWPPTATWSPTAKASSRRPTAPPLPCSGRRMGPWWASRWQRTFTPGIEGAGICTSPPSRAARIRPAPGRCNCARRGESRSLCP